MYIYHNNSFRQDALNARTQRLLAIKTYIEDWVALLALPTDIVNWGLAAYDLWIAALGRSTVEKGKAEEALQEVQEATALNFSYYSRCKKLLKDQYGQEEKIMKIYGLKGNFPDIRKEKLSAVQILLDGNATLVLEGDPHVLSTAFIDKLQGFQDASNTAYNDYVINIKPEAMKAVEEQYQLFEADTKRLRVLHSWALMTWTSDEPYLIQLGCAPSISRRGRGQPLAPQGLSYNSIPPDLTLSWQECKNTSSYQLAYSENQKDWEELYAGTELAYTYAPPPGNSSYKVRARNTHGYGEWSEVVVGTSNC